MRRQATSSVPRLRSIPTCRTLTGLTGSLRPPDIIFKTGLHMPKPIRIGISACLLGEKVRFDGGHKRDPLLAETLGRHVEWVGVCPEVEMGLGVPRETLCLVRMRGAARLVMPETGQDHTARMRRWAAVRVEQLAGLDLCGFALKKDSPSCGLKRVKVYGRDGVPHKTGRGLFAAALLGRFPDLPVEDEGRLHDPRIRDNFIERVLAYRKQSRRGLKTTAASRSRNVL